MRYWGYLAGKLLAAGLICYAAGAILVSAVPRPAPLSYLIAGQFGNSPGHTVVVDRPFGNDLGYTIIMMVFGLICAGVLWAICIDHRYRCRTCMRRLRMPIATGSWTHVLLSRPRTEYICPYGHGTLKVEELQITGRAEPDWQPHEDMWKELSTHEPKK
ncbi:MAG: hypothetical protein ABI995_13115 [Acidobacteriota bacterium]